MEQKTSLYNIAQNSEKIKQYIKFKRKLEDENIMSISDIERKNHLYEKYQKAEQYAVDNKLGLDILNPKN